MTIQETTQAIQVDRTHWLIPFMDFVDDFRRMRDLSAIQNPFESGDERLDALLASTVEYLCAEQGLEPPPWIWDVPACHDPWFVAGVENLKALAIAESPVYFRRRKIFVLHNFLERV